MSITTIKPHELRQVAESISYNHVAELLMNAANEIETLREEIQTIKTNLAVIINEGTQPKTSILVIEKQQARKNEALHQLRGNITMEQLAKHLNINERTIYKWFNSDLLPKKRAKIINAILELKKLQTV